MVQGAGEEVGDVLEMVERVKEDLRKELLSKSDLSPLDSKLTSQQDDIDTLKQELEREIKKRLESTDRLDQLSLKQTQELESIQADLRKLQDLLKQKADSDEVDSLNTLINDMY